MADCTPAALGQYQASKPLGRPSSEPVPVDPKTCDVAECLPRTEDASGSVRAIAVARGASLSQTPELR